MEVIIDKFGRPVKRIVNSQALGFLERQVDPDEVNINELLQNTTTANGTSGIAYDIEAYVGGKGKKVHDDPRDIMQQEAQEYEKKRTGR